MTLTEATKQKDVGPEDFLTPESGKPQPTDVPPFTLADIRRAIPPKCFERSLVTSFRYLFVDLFFVAVFYLLSQQIDSTFTDERFGAAGFYLRAAAWVLYWCCQGCVGTGLWVIGHECGHGAFADSEFIGDVVGWAVHSALLVPYFSWKISHRRHHANTNHLGRDEVFVPPVASPEDPGLLAESGGFQLGVKLLRAFHIVVMLTLGWPLYLFSNATGRPYPKGRMVNHFSPWSPIFNERERFLIVLSDVGILLALGALWKLYSLYGLVWLAKTYIVPYLIVNLFLVLITFLQHTDDYIPHYTEAEWDWLRGALATIDRDYGILNVVFHHITDTHVTHHLFSYMPHYHAQEATAAIKPLLGKYYRSDDTPIVSALWRAFERCNYVAPETQAATKAMLKQYGVEPKAPNKEVMWFIR